MPRLKKELVGARESFATQCAKEGKGLEDIQKLLVEEGPGGVKGMRMFVPRLETLIKEAQTGLPSTIKAAPVPASKPIHKPVIEADGTIETPVHKDTGRLIKAHKIVVAPPEEMKSYTCAADPCKTEFTAPAGRFTGKNLPLCPACKKMGMIAVTRRN